MEDMLAENFQLRLSKEEADALKAYAERTGRTQSDVIRGFIWSLMTTKDREELAISRYSDARPVVPTTMQYLRSTVIPKETE